MPRTLGKAYYKSVLLSFSSLHFHHHYFSIIILSFFYFFLVFPSSGLVRGVLLSSVGRGEVGVGVWGRKRKLWREREREGGSEGGWGPRGRGEVGESGGQLTAIERLANRYMWPPPPSTSLPHPDPSLSFTPFPSPPPTPPPLPPPPPTSTNTGE